MSCPLLVQDNTGSLVVFLQTTAGAAATSVDSTDLSAFLKKEGGSFSSFTLDGDNFTELGSGFYEIDLAAEDTDTLGNLYLRVSGTGVETSLVNGFVVEETPTSASPAQSVSIVNLFGYVNSPDGSALAGASVGARILSQPTVLQAGDEALVVGADLVTAKSDSSGFFTIGLIVGSEIEIFIPAANYRRTLTVPSTSQNVFLIP